MEKCTYDHKDGKNTPIIEWKGKWFCQNCGEEIKLEESNFDTYRYIDQETNEVIYYLSINCDMGDYQSRLSKKADELSRNKQIPFENIYWEYVPFLSV